VNLRISHLPAVVHASGGLEDVAILISLAIFSQRLCTALIRPSQR